MPFPQGCGLSAERVCHVHVRAAAIIGLSLAFCSHAAAGGQFSALAPQTVVRAPGPPAALTIPFQVTNPAAHYTLRVHNGGLAGAYTKVSSAVILLNGATVIGAQEFNQRIDDIERPVDLALSNELSVELRGRPGAALMLEVSGIDDDAPRITAQIVPPAGPTGWHRQDVTVDFACEDATSGIAVCPAPVTIADEGAAQPVSGTAWDRAGNGATASVVIHLDKTAPAVSFLEPVDGATVSGVLRAGVAVEDAFGIDRVEFTLDGAGVASDAGAPYGVTIDTTTLAGGAHTIGATAFDLAGNGAGALIRVTVANSALPPDPATVAPPFESAVAASLYAASAFLYTGADPIQTGVAADTIEPRRAAVLRGRITGRDGRALPGVAITVRGHPEFGATLSRADGVFDLAVNGGGPLTVDYQKSGYLPLQRRIDAPWQDYAWLPDVVMIGLDSQVTAIDLAASAAVQVAQGSIVTDEDGTRRAALLFPPGTTALMRLPDGASRALSTLHVRATEYTVGAAGSAALPGELPPTSAYTYAVEFSVDEALAAGAAAVEFSQPVISYLENFLDIPVGWEVPAAYYDRDKTAWIPAPNGRVVRIVAIDAAGLAQLDVDGSGAAADPQALSALGITAAEQRTLGGRYAVGQQLWRVPIPRFSPWDCNYAYGLSPSAIAPNAPPPRVEDSLEDPDCRRGSVIECQNQVLGESVPVAGTPYRLVYRSDGVLGRASSREIRIPLTPATVPYSLKEVTLDIRLAGRRFYLVFPPLPDQTHVFQWDGRDAYGREVRGAYTATIEIGYGYRPVYLPVPRLRAAFGAAGVPIVDVARRYRTTTVFTLRRRYQVQAASRDERARGFGGWTLDSVHAYDAVQRTLYLGDGSRRAAATIGRIIDTAAGNGAYAFGGDGGRAVAAGLRGPADVAAGPDGILYIADTGNDRIRRVHRDGTIATIAGGGSVLGDGGPATQALLSAPWGVAVGPDGSVYVADSGHGRIRRIAPSGIITTVAGNGQYGFSGDGGPATQAALAAPRGVALGRDGTLYIADTENHCVRRVGPDGVIHTVAGGKAPGFWGDGGSAYDAYLYLPYAVAVGHAGEIYVADTGNGRVRRVAPSGTIDTLANANVMDVATGADGAVYVAEAERYRVVRVDDGGATLTPMAGSGAWGYCGDVGPAAQACLNRPSGIGLGPDGTFYIADSDNNRIRRAYFPLPGYHEGESVIASEGGAELYRFDAAGRHRATLDALSGALRREYLYDGAGHLNALRDADGNTVTVERHAEGAPSAIVGPGGQRTDLMLDDAGYLSGVSNPQGEAYRFSYTADGLLLSLTDPNGNTSQMAYDAWGRLVRDRNAAGGYTELTRTDHGDGAYVVEAGSAEGRVAAYRVARLATGEVRTKTAPDGTVEETVVDHLGGTRSVVQADGTAFQYALGPDPRFGMEAPVPRAALVTPSGLRMETERVRSVERDPFDPAVLVAQTEEVRVNGLVVGASMFYAADSRIVSTGVDGVRTLYLDGRGHVTRELASLREPVSYGYDLRGRLSVLTQGVGSGARSVGFAYDGSGNLAVVTDALGRSTRFEYDRAGRVVRRTLPDGRAVVYAYDANGNVLSITPPGRSAHVFSYNAADREEAYTPPYAGPGTGVTRYSYDLDRQLTRIVRPDGVAVGFRYDAGGRLAAVALPRGAVEYSYHPETGQLTRLAVPGGTVVSYAYDGALPVSEAWSGEVSGEVTRIYGNLLLPTTVSVDGVPVSYRYDRHGRVTEAGALSIDYGVGDRVSATSIGGSGGGGSCDPEMPGCDPRRPPPPSVPPLTTAHAYSGFGELESVAAAYGGTQLLSVLYSRDALGRITRKVETVSGATTTYDYVYDSSGRLAEVRENGATTVRYEYDGNGNRTGGFTGRGAISALYDAQDRLLSYNGAAYGYTGNGELRSKTVFGAATTYDYDVLGNLRNVLLPGDIAVEYVIDGRNRRVGKKINGQLVQGFLYQDQLNPIAELDGSGNVVARFVYGSKGNCPDYMIREGVTYRIISDHLGSPRLAVDVASGVIAQRMDYDEFGNVTLDTNPGFQPFGFAGGLYDRHTGLVRFGARDYDPELGRWTAKDPIGFAGGDTNLYSYALNDPADQLDVDGKIIGSLLAKGLQGIRGLRPEEVALHGKGYDAAVGLLLERTNISDRVPNGLGDVLDLAELWGGFQSFSLGWAAVVTGAEMAAAIAPLSGLLGGYVAGASFNNLFERHYGLPVGVAFYDWMHDGAHRCD